MRSQKAPVYKSTDATKRPSIRDFSSSTCESVNEAPKKLKYRALQKFLPRSEDMRDHHHIGEPENRGARKHPASGPCCARPASGNHAASQTDSAGAAAYGFRGLRGAENAGCAFASSGAGRRHRSGRPCTGTTRRLGSEVGPALFCVRADGFVHAVEDPVFRKGVVEPKAFERFLCAN